MSFSVIQAGSALKFVNEDGIVSADLTLPTGVTLRTDVVPRFVLFGRSVVLVNTPNVPLAIDADGTVRVLTPHAPRIAPSLSGVTGGTLSGNYAGVRYTHVVFDSEGRLIGESDYSPASGSVTLTSQYLKASGLETSPDAISARRVYRPTTDGAVNFEWVDLDGNILTSVQDDTPDAGLSQTASPILGTPPDLTLIAEFRDRLWGVDRLDVDDLRHSEVGLMYAWPADNVFPVPPVGADFLGVTALLPRRESLGIGRENQLLMLVGTDDTNFQVARLSQHCGVVSQETVSVYRDVAYFLWHDGVYAWGDDGITCLSDGKVRSWFATDDTFDRSKFKFAFGGIDPLRNKYRLYLHASGSANEIRWVEVDLTDRTWWGPHLTRTYRPTSVFTLVDGQLVPRQTFGSATGDLYREQEHRTDGVADAIDFDVITKQFSMNEADLDKFWGQLSVIQAAQPEGDAEIIVSAGELDAAPTNTLKVDLTQSRQRLQRVGTGKHVSFEVTQDVEGQDIRLFGLEVNPVQSLGRR